MFPGRGGRRGGMLESSVFWAMDIRTVFKKRKVSSRLITAGKRNQLILTNYQLSPFVTWVPILTTNSHTGPLAKEK